jgi:two-component system chemotaxis response regulator CheB
MSPPNGNEGSAARKKVRVFIAEDSGTVRTILVSLLNADPDIEVVGMADNGDVLPKELARCAPDVLLLDLVMPGVSGLDAFEAVRRKFPEIRVVMMSGKANRKLAENESAASSAGVKRFLHKPGANVPLEDFRRKLLAYVKDEEPGEAAPAPKREDKAAPADKSAEIEARRQAKRKEREAESRDAPPPSAIVRTQENPPPVRRRHAAPQKALAVAIGCSTGGPNALSAIFNGLRRRPPMTPIFIAQHMPEQFTLLLADRLRQESGMDCREAEDGETVVPNRVYVAKGGYHMTVERKDKAAVIRLNQGPKVHFCRPAVDPLFYSMSDVYGSRLLAVLLTGMGQDGADGARRVREKGGSVIIQDRATSIVWGMPGAAFAQKAFDDMLPLDEIPNAISAMAETCST